MQKSPELIIEEFEVRRDAEVATRKRKFRRRAFDVSQLVVAVIGFVFLSDSKSPTFAFAPLMIFAYLTAELQKRWALEDRVATLESKTA